MVFVSTSYHLMAVSGMYRPPRDAVGIDGCAAFAVRQT